MAHHYFELSNVTIFLHHDNIYVPNLFLCHNLWNMHIEIINKYRMKVAKHEEDINDILKQEKEEKEVMDRVSQVHLVMIYGLASSGRDGNEQGS